MDKYFIDSDIILDLLLDRKPFIDSSEVIFHAGASRTVKLFTSSIILNNVHYIARRLIGRNKSLSMITNLLDFVDVPSTGKKEILDAIKYDFTDFEDGIQYATALTIPGLKAIVTRNIRDYKSSSIPVINSDEFISSFLAQCAN